MPKRFKTAKHSVLDTKTGLEWQKNCAGRMNWHEAMQYARDLKLGKYLDWRLPTIEELITLINFEKNDPASSFPGMSSSVYWSSSSYHSVPQNRFLAWYVDFRHGWVDAYDKANCPFVRCVRRGPWTPGPSGKVM